jgi:hypothetical protein
VGGSEGKRERRRVEGEMGRGVGGKSGYERGKREWEWELRMARWEKIEEKQEARKVRGKREGEWKEGKGRERTIRKKGGRIGRCCQDNMEWKGRKRVAR